MKLSTLSMPALGLALALGVTGCQAAVPTASPVEQNKAAVVRWLEEGDNKNNLAIADEVFAPDVVMYHPTSPTPVRGVETIKQGAAGLRAAFPDNIGTIHDVIGEGDRVVVRWTLRGTHKGAFMGVEPTGKAIAVPGISMYRFAGGKVVEAWYGVNMIDFYHQIGVTPPAPAPAP
jgi:steroid delta-isomerase-like uncharacterized protein